MPEHTESPAARDPNADEAHRGIRARRDHDRFRELFELAPEPYLLTDDAGRIKLANARTLGLLGRVRAEVEDAQLEEFLHPDDRPALRAQLDRISTGAGMHSWEVRLAGANEQRVLASVEPYADPGNGIELRWVLWDARPLELVRAHLHRLLDDSRGDAAALRSVVEWQASLLGAAAHDMGTPLSIIDETLESLLESDDLVTDLAARAMLARAANQVVRLRRLLPTLLQLGRLQRAHAGTTRDWLDLRQVVDEVLHDLAPLNREVTYAFHVEQIHAERLQLARALVELVTHVQEHVPAATPLLIGATAKGVDVELHLDVEGHVVPDAVRQLVASPFLGSGPDAAATTGDDLGLSLVGVFARMHGGRAWVEQTEGGGSSFRVLLSNAQPEHYEAD